ncbi:MAG: hypothetical protein U5R49_17830 [Deltaproteobacteria bacterium]|nr:hypothetical protein [Deltaproteobacteria bacterium]
MSRTPLSLHPPVYGDLVCASGAPEADFLRDRNASLSSFTFKHRTVVPHKYGGMCPKRQLRPLRQRGILKARR